MTDWIVGSSILIVMIFAIRKVFGMRIQQQVSICTLGSCDDSSALPSDTME